MQAENLLNAENERPSSRLAVMAVMADIGRSAVSFSDVRKRKIEKENETRHGGVSETKPRDAEKRPVVNLSVRLR